MPGILDDAAISGDVSRALGLGPRRRVSRILKAAYSRVRNLGNNQDSLSVLYSSWLENDVISSIARTTKWGIRRPHHSTLLYMGN